MIIAKIHESFPSISTIDETFITAYATKLDDQSSRSHNLFGLIIPEFYAFVKKPILDITLDDVNGFIAILSARVATSSVISYMKFIRAFYRFSLKLHAGNTRELITDVFRYVDMPKNNPRTIKSKTGHKVDLDDLDGESKIIPDNELHTIIKFAFARGIVEHVLFGILKHTGMRISEVITIRNENIDFEKRVIVSGTVKDFSKEGIVIHPFPKFMIIPIKKLIAINRGTEWLFESPRYPNRFRKYPQTLIDRFRRDTGIDFTFHQFRHTLITKRSQNGCDRELNEYLNNHAASGTQARFYDFRNWTIDDRVRAYDKWHPFSEI